MSRKPFQAAKAPPSLGEIDLDCGVSFRLRSYDASWDLGAEMEASRAAYPDGKLNMDAYELAATVALARRAVADWAEGQEVLGPDRQPWACTPEHVEAILRNHPGAAADFRLKYRLLLRGLQREGEVSGASLPGTSGEAPDTAPTAEVTSSPAPSSDGDAPMSSDSAA